MVREITIDGIKYREVEPETIVIQEWASGLLGIKVVPKEKISFYIKGKYAIEITGMYGGKENTIYVEQSMSALKKAIAKYEELTK